MVNINQDKLKRFPGVDKLLNLPEIKSRTDIHGNELITFAIRHVLDKSKSAVMNGEDVPATEAIIESVDRFVNTIVNKSLRNVINASGIVIHTNLGRAPFSSNVIDQSMKLLKGYTNLEFDLEKGKRGSRYTHVSALLRYLTGAGDVLVVNNNAAAIMLILRTFAKDKEVIVSRGELIEIGGSFRMPDIIASSDCKMVEVGTTNKTKITDFKAAVCDNTGALLKAHTSNYQVVGFTEEAGLKDLVDLGKKHNIPVFYDMGSGLLRKLPLASLSEEPNVQKTLATGIDLVCFSGDKLLGGPQAGIIAGKKEFIAKLKKEPMVRALRVGKLTLAFLEATCQQYLDHQSLADNNQIYNILSKTSEDLEKQAEILKNHLAEAGIESEILRSKGQFGGGSLPGKELDSFAVKITGSFSSNRQKSLFAEKIHRGLLDHENPVLAILKKGDIYFDVLSLYDEDIPQIADIVNDVNQGLEL